MCMRNGTCQCKSGFNGPDCSKKLDALGQGNIWISGKVEKILKGSLVLIPSPSPSVKIKFKLWAGKFAWGCQQTFENKKFVDLTQQCFDLLPQMNLPANNLNFHRR